MTHQESGALILKFLGDNFIFIAMFSIMLSFVFRLIIRNSSFEYLKISSSIVILAFTLILSAELYKDEQENKFKDRIINIKSSNLLENKKKEYIKEFEKEIIELDNFNVNIVFGIASALILGTTSIMLRDNIPKIVLLRKNREKRKNNKLL